MADNLRNGSIVTGLMVGAPNRLWLKARARA